MKLLPACAHPVSPRFRRVALGALVLASLGASPPAAPRAARPLADAATKIDFTFTGAGHQNEAVHLRDNYPDVPAPQACFYHDGIIFGIQGPVLALRTDKQGPKIWGLRLYLQGTPASGSLPAVSSEPALVYSGGEPGQQSFFPQLMLPPLKRGTLSAKLLPAPKGRLRGTFAGTLITDKGEFVTVSNGSFDLPRRPDGN